MAAKSETCSAVAATCANESVSEFDLLYACKVCSTWLIPSTMDEIAIDTPGIVRVLDDVPPVRFPIWLVSHRELRTLRRIRVVFEALVKGLSSDSVID